MARKIIRNNQVKPVNSEVTKGVDVGIHYVVQNTFLCSKLLGLLPLSGLCNNVGDVRFAWNTPFILIVIFSTFGQISMFCLCSMRLFKYGLTLYSFSRTFFYACGMLSTFLLINFSYHWPQLLKKVTLIESKLPPLSKKVRYYCDVALFAVLITATVEYSLSIMYIRKIAYVCRGGESLELFFTTNLPIVFEVTSYSLWKGILAQFSNLQSAFMWSYCDLLIMVISIYLAEYMATHIKTLNQSAENRNIDWNHFRIQHLDVVTLVKILDERIGYFIIISFTANMYWICIQLFNILNRMTTTDRYCAGRSKKSDDDLLHIVYYTFSFAYLVGRTLAVALLAAKIHARSTSPLTLLFEVPAWEYNIEVRRFIHQINNITVALSGHEFFFVTRGMLLTLIGTIVTYELVLVQFNTSTATTTTTLNETVT